MFFLKKNNIFNIFFSIYLIIWNWIILFIYIIRNILNIWIISIIM